MKNYLACIGACAITALIVGILVHLKDSKDFEMALALANAKPVITVHKDTTPSPPISIIHRLNPVKDSTKRPLPATVSSSHDSTLRLTSGDSLALMWGYFFVNYWGFLGYTPQQAADLQDSLTAQRTLEVRDSTIGYLKALYTPLPDFILSLTELRPPKVSSDTTKTIGPILQPPSIWDPIIRYGGYALLLIFVIVGLK